MLTTTIKRRTLSPTPSVKVAPILILTVTLDKEKDAIEKALPSLDAQPQPKTPSEDVWGLQRWVLPRPNGKTLDLYTGYLNKMGNAGSALETFLYLDKVRCRFVFLCGIAGSLDPDSAHLGDVVVARSINWLRVNKLSENTFKQCHTIGGKHFRIEKDPFACLRTSFLERKVGEFVEKNKYLLPSNRDNDTLRFKEEEGIVNDAGHVLRNEIHLAGVASWEFVLSDLGIREYILKTLTPECLAIEMEGGGFKYAVKRMREDYNRVYQGQEIPGFDGFIFRGIADLSEKKDTTNTRWQSIAMKNASAAIVAFINTISDETFAEVSGISST